MLHFQNRSGFNQQYNIAMNEDGLKINEKGVGNVNRRCEGYGLEISMVNLQRNILILIIVLLATSMPKLVAQTNPQLTLALVGQSTDEDLAPAGQTTVLKLEILNVGRADLYLLRGEAYLDPDLSGTWELVRSEMLGSFHLGFLQSAIWAFDLTVPATIQAANATGGAPQVNLLIKIIYQPAGESQTQEQGVFALRVPGATVQQQYDLNWYVFAGVLTLVCVGAAYLVTKRRLRR